MTEERTRRLAAVWFADIVGYTALSAKDEDAALEVVDELQRAADEAVADRDGRVVKYMGDAVLCIFDSVDAALHAAFDLQIRFAKSTVVKRQGVGLRVGLHLGEIVEAEDGDVYGDGVNTASRIEGVARPGEVAVTGSVHQQIRNRPQFRTEELGKKELKGLDSMSVYSVTLADAPPILVAQKKALAAKPSYRRAAGVGIAASVIGFITLTVLIAQSQDTGSTLDSEPTEQVTRSDSDTPVPGAGAEGSETPPPEREVEATSTEDDAAEDTSTAAEPSTLRTPPRFGAWTVDAGTDFMDDSDYAVLQVDAAQGVAAKLVLECRGNHEIRIDFPRRLSSDEVEVRLGTSRARNASNQWELGGDGSSLVYRGDPRRLIRSLVAVQMLGIQAPAESGPPMSAGFPVTGLRAALDDVRSACAL